MTQIKSLINIFLLALLPSIIFLPVPAVLSQGGVCPNCAGPVCDPKGCCKTSESCFVPTSKECCDLTGGTFYDGDMSCKVCEKPTAIRLSSLYSRVLWQ